MKCRAHPKACVATYQKYMPTQWRGCPSNRRRVHVSPYAHSQSCALYVHILPLSLHMSLAHLCLGRAQVSWSVVRLVSQLVGWHTGRTQSVSLSSGWSVSWLVGTRAGHSQSVCHPVGQSVGLWVCPVDHHSVGSLSLS